MGLKKWLSYNREGRTSQWLSFLPLSYPLAMANSLESPYNATHLPPCYRLLKGVTNTQKLAGA